jgi:hypothetical protein
MRVVASLLLVVASGDWGTAGETDAAVNTSGAGGAAGQGGVDDNTGSVRQSCPCPAGAMPLPLCDVPYELGDFCDETVVGPCRIDYATCIFCNPLNSECGTG